MKAIGVMGGNLIKNKIEEQDKNIRRVEQECQAAIMSNSTTSSGCPRTWDGVMCWPDSPPGHLTTLPCPEYIFGFNESMLASKWCTNEGEWFVRSANNKTWTNYTQCYDEPTANIIVDYPPLENSSYLAAYIPVVKFVSHVGYAVSLATLLVAFYIFATVRPLRCSRNKMHMNLFASFMLRAFSTILKSALLVKGIGLASDFTVIDGETYFNHDSKTLWICKLLISVWQYCIMANYSWILMEGLYLHHLITFTFSENQSIVVFVILGWGLPFVFVGPWVLVRIFLEDTFCWTTNDNSLYFQLIKIPTTLSILINLFLFIKILRVLHSKLNATVNEEAKAMRYRKLAKSTLVLVPLFGVHYAVYLTMSYLGVEGKVELVWLFIDQLFASFQGCLVAFLYCLLNLEVQQELSRKWGCLPSFRRSYEHRASLPLSTVSQQPLRRSYLGAVFSRRRGPRRNQQNGYMRGSNADTYMSTVGSSVATDAIPSTSFVTHNPHPRGSVIPSENAECTTPPDQEESLLT